ncbi:hypothetical protein BABINDRAFT_158864 [Babjeviella inositovora NRRL Y-12698]|uniref:Uncharacterized protein n=1 Tax=Babjeviella inositovora NRRL Y-12698 TaxID=984486 RepID=A0A1E3QXF6_9ASCO|nr:uncharacterized protein BABINDRAFT_158864 [Babjeviella inositovora NRRL Y-12698]ODQ82224.1 hypothetical protein BABINDRAFT_158864 [Babjeviella inositovora NRRL Y-12698]
MNFRAYTPEPKSPSSIPYPFICRSSQARFKALEISRNRSLNFLFNTPRCLVLW